MASALLGQASKQAPQRVQSPEVTVWACCEITGASTCGSGQALTQAEQDEPLHEVVVDLLIRNRPNLPNKP